MKRRMLVQHCEFIDAFFQSLGAPVVVASDGGALSREKHLFATSSQKMARDFVMPDLKRDFGLTNEERVDLMRFAENKTCSRKVGTFAHPDPLSRQGEGNRNSSAFIPRGSFSGRPCFPYSAKHVLSSG